MLYSVDNGKYVTRVPHQKDYDRWMKKLSSEDYIRIADTLNEKTPFVKVVVSKTAVFLVTSFICLVKSI